jgi:hypothetical protein
MNRPETLHLTLGKAVIGEFRFEIFRDTTPTEEERDFSHAYDRCGVGHMFPRRGADETPVPKVSLVTRVGRFGLRRRVLQVEPFR